MNKKIRIAIIGYGNIGRCAAEAVHMAEDMELVGLVDPIASLNSSPEAAGIPSWPLLMTYQRLRLLYYVHLLVLCLIMLESYWLRVLIL